MPGRRTIPVAVAFVSVAPAPVLAQANVTCTKAPRAKYSAACGTGGLEFALQ